MIAGEQLAKVAKVVGELKHKDVVDLPGTNGKERLVRMDSNIYEKMKQNPEIRFEAVNKDCILAVYP